MAQKTGMKSAYPLTKSQRDSQKLGEQKIRKSLEILEECDKNLKSTSADGRLLLEQTLIKLSLVAKGEKI